MVVNKRTPNRLTRPPFERNRQAEEFGQDMEAEIEQAAPSYPIYQSPFQRMGGVAGLMQIMGNIQQIYGVYQNVKPTMQMLNSLMVPQAAISGTRSRKRTASQRRGKRRSTRLRFTTKPITQMRRR